jgi:methyl-accepting chemotaxis protein
MIQEDFKKINLELGKLSVIRMKVDKFEGIVEDYLKYYTQTISKILLLTRDINVLVKGNIELGNAINSYYNLLNYKERQGITRATFAGIFSNNSFTKFLYKRAIEINVESNEYFKNYEYYSKNSQIDFYKSTVAGDDIELTDKLIKSALDNSDSPNLDINPTIWFDAITGKINKLKIVEDKHAKELIEMAQSFYDQSFKIIIISFIGGLILVVSIIYFIIYHSNKIVKPIKMAAYIAEEISKGNIVDF